MLLPSSRAQHSPNQEQKQIPISQILHFYTHISEFSTSPLYFKYADNAFQGPYQCSLSHCPHKFPPCNKLPIRASLDKQHCFSQTGIRSYSGTGNTAAMNHNPVGHHRAATAGRSATHPSANGTVSLPQARMLGFQLSSISCRPASQKSSDRSTRDCLGEPRRLSLSEMGKLN